jgi:hypothetical protein
MLELTSAKGGKLIASIDEEEALMAIAKEFLRGRNE